MANKLCVCQGRKCGCLATPYVIKTVTNRLGKATFEELRDWVIQRVAWRRKQEERYGKGVQPHNVKTFLARVNSCDTKGGLLCLLENTANAYHRKIQESQECQEPEDSDFLFDNCDDEDGLNHLDDILLDYH